MNKLPQITIHVLCYLSFSIGFSQAVIKRENISTKSDQYRARDLFRVVSHYNIASQYDSSSIAIDYYERELSKTLNRGDIALMKILKKQVAYKLRTLSEKDFLKELKTFYTTVKKEFPSFDHFYYEILAEFHNDSKGIVSERLFNLIKASEANKKNGNISHAAYINQHIARIYYEYGEYKTSLEYSKAILCCMSEFSNANKILTNNLVAASYQRLMQYDSAVYYHDITGKIDATRDDWQGLSRGFMGDAYFEKGDYDKALPLIQLGLVTAQKYQYNVNIASFLMNIASIYSHKGAYAQSNKTFAEAQTYLKKESNLAEQKEFYTLLIDHFRRTGKAENALLAHDSLEVVEKLLTQVYDRNLKTSAETKALFQLAYEREANLEHEINLQRYLRNALILATILILGITFLYYRKSKIDLKLENANITISRDKLSYQVALANQSLENTISALKEKSQIIEKLQTEVTMSENTSYVEAMEDVVKELRHYVILTEENWLDFQDKFDEVHKGFITKLRSSFKDLTPAEHRFICLTKLHLNNKEMANLLGVTPDAVRNVKSRLKRKLNNGESEEFSEQIKAMIS